MKALSVKQPWASLIVNGVKNIENRTWKTKFRGRIYIHASAKGVPNFDFNQPQHEILIDVDTENMGFPYSAIIGEVDIIDCVINHPSIWAEKTDIFGTTIEGEMLCVGKPIWNWVLANPVLYDKPILNVRGNLSFWEPTIDIVDCVGCSQKFDSEIMEEDNGGEKFCPECCEILFPVMAQEAEECKDLEDE